MLQPFIGASIDWLDRRKAFIQGGLIMMGLASIGFIFATRFADLLLLRLLQGVGLAATIPAALAVLAANSKKQTRGGTMGVYTSARMLRLTIGPLIGGALFDTLGFEAAFITAAVFTCWLPCPGRPGLIVGQIG